MRKPIVTIAFVALLGVGYWVYDAATRERALDPVIVSPAETVARPVVPPPAAPESSAAPEPLVVQAVEPNAVPEPVLDDDGDLHGHDHEPRELQTLVEPPEEYSYDRDPVVGERAALAHARSMLETLADDPDPAVREEIAALLAVIAETQEVQ